MECKPNPDPNPDPSMKEKNLTARISVSSLSEISENSGKSVTMIVQPNKDRSLQRPVRALDQREACRTGYSLLCQRYIMQPKTLLLASFTFSIRLLEQLY